MLILYIYIYSVGQELAMILNNVDQNIFFTFVMQNYWILETFRECKNTTRSFILIQLTEVSHQIANPNRKLSCTKISNSNFQTSP